MGPHCCILGGCDLFGALGTVAPADVCFALRIRSFGMFMLLSLSLNAKKLC